MDRIKCKQSQNGNYVIADFSNLSDHEAFKLVLFCRRIIVSTPQKSINLLLDLSNSELSFNTQMTFTSIFEKFQPHLIRSCFVGLDNPESELSYLLKSFNDSFFSFFENRDDAEEYLLYKPSLTA